MKNRKLEDVRGEEVSRSIDDELDAIGGAAHVDTFVCDLGKRLEHRGRVGFSTTQAVGEESSDPIGVEPETHDDFVATTLALGEESAD